MKNVIDRKVFFDTETTGISPQAGHRIIEVGCVEMINRRLTGNNFHRYLNPERDIDAGALAVHGLSAEFLSDKPKFAEIIHDLIEYLKGCELVIHNAPFDTSFMDHEIRRANCGYQDISHYCQIFDTLSFARRKHPGQKNSLDALCRRYNVDNSNRALHGALLDSELLADVYCAMTREQVSLFNEQVIHQQSLGQKVEAFKQVKRSGRIPVIAATLDELNADRDYFKD